MINILLIKDWVNSMEKYVSQLEKATEKKDKNEINRLRTLIFELYKNINSELERKNV